MKIARSSKLHFHRWLTQHKQEQIQNILEEYSRIVNYFIGKYERRIPELKKFDLCLAFHIQNCIKETNTWFTARMV